MSRGTAGPSRNPRLTAIPAARSSAPVLKIRLVLVLGSLLLAAASGVFATVAWRSYRPPDVASAVEAKVPYGRGFAELVANAYLDGERLAFPVAEGIDFTSLESSGFDQHTEPRWDGFDRYSSPLSGTFERHNFVFLRTYTPAGAEKPRTDVMKMSILVAVVPPGRSGLGGNVALAAAPYVFPTSYGSTTAVSDYSKDAKPTDLPAAARDKLTDEWLIAFAEGDETALKTLSGEPGDFRYPGIGGFVGSKSKLTILRAYLYDAQADIWLVRARVSLVSANELESQMDLDITIENGSKANAVIVGWGPPGTGALSREQFRVAE